MTHISENCFAQILARNSDNLITAVGEYIITASIQTKPEQNKLQVVNQLKSGNK